jgi:hypothetical protein
MVGSQRAALLQCSMLCYSVHESHTMPPYARAGATKILSMLDRQEELGSVASEVSSPTAKVGRHVHQLAHRNSATKLRKTLSRLPQQEPPAAAVEAEDTGMKCSWCCNTDF